MKKLRAVDQNYDAWLHWDVTKRCNLSCKYCFGMITDSSVKINSINIDKLIKTLDRSGKTFRISFTGGEPTMVPNFIETIKEVCKKHYISFNTNLITKKILKITEVDPQRILHIHASFHYDELIEKRLLYKFIENFNFLRDYGFNIYTEAVAYPPFVNKVNEMKKLLAQENIELNFAPFLDSSKNKNYPESYTDLELKQFEIPRNNLSNFSQKGELCNAGFNAFVVFSNGDIYPCHQIKNNVGNIYDSFNFDDFANPCPSKRCGCPLNKYDKYLFEKAVNKIGESS